MKKLKAAWIGFMDYESIQKGGDPFAYFESYANMGYRGWDSDLGRLSGDRDANYKRFKDLGLKCLSSWAPSMHDLVNNPDEVKRLAEKCDYYGVDNVTIGNSSVISSFGLGYGNNGDYNSMMKDIEVMDKLVKLFAPLGITCLYHNHYQEFTVDYKGVSVIDYFLSQVDKALKLKLDIGWVYVGGEDPVNYMEKVKDRIHLLHVKDFTDMIQPRYLVNKDKETDFGFTTLGTGKLDLKGVLKKALEIGIDYAIVEQDRMRNLSMKDSLLCSYLNMKETGFIE